MTKSRNIMKPRFIWQPWHIEFLEALYPFTTVRALSKVLGCTEGSIHNQCHKRGLKKSAWFKSQIMSVSIRGKDSAGARHRFPKGHVPANKGVKGVSYPGCVKTQFKKGNKPQTTLPVGSYRYDKQGLLQRKISEQSGNNSKRWRGVHELVWVAANGPVPARHICVFKPGLKTSKLEEITLDRVECISLAENMRRNSYHTNYGKDVARLIQLKGALKRQINRKEKS